MFSSLLLFDVKLILPQNFTCTLKMWVKINHFVATGKPERQVRKASHCGSKQQ